MAIVNGRTSSVETTRPSETARNPVGSVPAMSGNSARSKASSASHGNSATQTPTATSSTP